jgi:tetratricopeptide (TPR) repeat protein
LQLQNALELFRALGDRRGAAVVQSNLAILFARDGRQQSAREANEEALDAFRTVGATLDVARLQFNLGIQDRRAGRLVETETRFREALQGFTRMGAADVRLQVLASLGELMLARAEPDAAEALLRDVDEAEAAVPRRAALATARGRLAALRGEFETARSDFGAALALREQAGLGDWARMSELDLAELAAREGRLAEAEQSARSLRRAMLEARDGHAAFSAGILLAGAMAAQGEVAAAVRMFDELENDLEKIPDAMLALRLDLLRAATRRDEREPALRRVAQSARNTGFELLALRAELLAGGSTGEQARTRLNQLGIAIEGMPPPLPY